MSRHTEERTIGEFTFTVTQLGSTHALRCMLRLGKVLGPSLKNLIEAIGEVDLKQPTLATMRMDRVGEAIAALFEKLTEQDLDYFIKTLLEGALVDNRPLMREFEATLQGRVDIILALLVFAIEVNFSSFFLVLRAKAESLQTTASTSVRTLRKG